MPWLKGDIVGKAYEELSIAGYNFDLDPEELQAGCVTLDAMMAEWDARGIKLGYPLADGPGGSDLNDSTNLPAYAVRPVWMNHAKAMAASNGKALTAQQLEIAKQGYDLLLSKAAMPGPTQFPNTLPIGAGNKSWRRQYQGPFFPVPNTSPLGNDDSGGLDFLGD